MYMILENPKRMTKKEMRKEFANKWVFLWFLQINLGRGRKTEFMTS